MRPTRQSLTNRFVSPERTMVGRNETEPWKEESESERCSESHVSYYKDFFFISIPFCFVLPCFATGCHPFNFQIATAALRPRNDTKIGTGFYLLRRDFDAQKRQVFCKTCRFCVAVRTDSTFCGRQPAFCPAASTRPGVESREPLNQSAAALSVSFAPTYWFENLEIRKGFLRFPNLNLEQNPALIALAIESEVP